MLVLLLSLAQQTAAPPPAGGERFSILAQPCAPEKVPMKGEVVVCGANAANSQRLPLPQFRGRPDHAGPSNPEMQTIPTLEITRAISACGAYFENCPVAGGGNVQTIVLGAVANAAKDVLSGKPIFPKKPDKRGRVPIDLDAAPPEGRLLP